MNLKRVSLGLIALSFLVSCSNKDVKVEAQPTEYPTEVVNVQDTELLSSYPATVKGQEDIEIRPRIDGFIDAIYVDEGSVVRKGQSLFKINSPQTEQAYNSAKAVVTSAQAQLNTAQLNVDRMKPLADKGIVSKVQYDTYVNAYDAAKASLIQAKATLANAEATLSWTTVTSPVDGIIGAIPYRQGSLVDKANVLTTVANTDNVYVYFSLNEKELVSLLDGLDGRTQAEKISTLPEVTFTMADKTVYPEKGRIKTITGQANLSTGSVTFRADFPNKEGLLRSGFSGNIAIPKHVENAIVIPQAATFTKQNKYLAYKVIEGDIAVQALISVVSTPDGKSYVVTEGLSNGDRIVTNGITTLADSTKIIVK